MELRISIIKRMKVLISIIYYLTCTSVVHAQYIGTGFDGQMMSPLAKLNILDSLSCHGNAGDGVAYVFLPKMDISDDVVFRGSVDDGIALTDLDFNGTTDSLTFRGLSNDGFVSSFTTKVDITDTFAFHGLHADGIAFLYMDKMVIEDMVVFKGNTADGSGSTLLQKQMMTDDIAFKGLIGKGDHLFEIKKPDCLSEVLVWTGIVSQAWENPDNWQCGVLPSLSSEVNITPSALLFPQVTIDDEIKKLVLFPTTSFFINNTVNFIINGQ